MIALAYLSLISGAVLASLYLIGRAGDVAARVHRERDQWKAQ